MTELNKLKAKSHNKKKLKNKHSKENILILDYEDAAAQVLIVDDDS